MRAKPERLALVPRGFVLWIRLPQRIRHGSQAALEQDWRNLENTEDRRSAHLTSGAGTQPSLGHTLSAHRPIVWG